MTHQWNSLLDVVFNENLKREVNLKQKNKYLLTTGLTENPIEDTKSSSSNLVEVVFNAVWFRSWRWKAVEFDVYLKMKMNEMK